MENKEKPLYKITKKPLLRKVPVLKNIFDTMCDQSKDAKQLIESAWKFGEKSHEDQKRLSGDPYFNHPALVALYLAEIGMDKKTIAAGLLHDILEDTPTNALLLEERFGIEIRILVEGVTRLGNIKHEGYEWEGHTETIRRLFLATAQDMRTIIIKLADRLHNMQTLEFHDKKKQQMKARETMELYVPIADRLGMGKLRQDLEDLSFSFLNPEKYTETENLQKQKLLENKKKIDLLHKALNRELATLKITFNTEIHTKGLHRLYKKLERKGNEWDQVPDYFTFSVVVPRVSDCYRAMGLIHSKWRPLPNKIKDFIAFPKPNGYQAIETTVFSDSGVIFEIHIFTEEMLLQAKYGIAFFLSPKEFYPRLSKNSEKPVFSVKDFIYSLFKVFTKGENISLIQEKICEVPLWIRKMVENQKNIMKPDEFVEGLTRDFFNHRIFVFTSKGEIIDLPQGSSGIDFAYAVGPDLGNHISVIRVDHKIVPLSQELRNGDIVEIEIDPKIKPTKNWLKFAKTIAAQQLINLYLQKHAD